MMSFSCVSFGLVAALCVVAAHSAWEESTVVPVRLDPVQAAGSPEQWRTLSDEEKEKDSERRVFQLDVFGQRMILDLEPDQTFLAPGFIFQVVGQTGTPKPETQQESDSAAYHCFYSGSVNGEVNSAAALNLCHGLKGGFYLHGEEYFIQPSNATDVQTSEVDLHLIRRRSRGSLAEEGSSKCGVNEEEERVPESPEKEAKEGDPISDYTAHHRSRRFVSTPRYVEIMLVADQSMAEFHGAGLKPYLLTIMAVASRLYRHPTIRNPISLAVVKLLVVYDEQHGPEVSSNAALTLRNFCKWQRQHNPPSDRNPEHYDTAVLFTRQVLHTNSHVCLNTHICTYMYTNHNTYR
ncbi:hypothetical protein JZ751_028124 [Albula glossodonta]|uniref:Uncharacterized protein n=1 Tax=Albula glossodonta TaxID=121402 RepID=A0A8T2PD61_9TELE|nr:hypothetical protein JZ751_028124 [Albula glossodonta]